MILRKVEILLTGPDSYLEELNLDEKMIVENFDQVMEIVVKAINLSLNGEFKVEMFPPGDSDGEDKR